MYMGVAVRGYYPIIYGAYAQRKSLRYKNMTPIGSTHYDCPPTILQWQMPVLVDQPP